MIYVDELVNRGWRMGENCHMISDDISPSGLEALHRMAEAIGLKRGYFQPRSFPHYDLVRSKRALALKRGVQPISFRELSEIMDRARDAQKGGKA